MEYQTGAGWAVWTFQLKNKSEPHDGCLKCPKVSLKDLNKL